MQAARQVVAKTLEGSNQEEKTDWGVMKEKIRADLKRYIVEGDVAAAADHAGDSGSVVTALAASGLPGRLRSGFRGARRACTDTFRRMKSAAWRLLFATRSASAKPCAATAVTIAGAGTGVTGARVPLGGWVLSLEKFTAPGSSPGICHRRRGRAAARSARRGAAHRPVLSARPHRNLRQHRRHHRHQRQRLAQLPLRRHAPLDRAAARSVRRWHACANSRAATPSISTRARSRCPPSPRTPPATCCAPAWIGSTCSSARKARWEWSPKRA